LKGRIYTATSVNPASLSVRLFQIAPNLTANLTANFTAKKVMSKSRSQEDELLRMQFGEAEMASA